ncbi:protein FAR1-RELATED SEQUENCE 5-like [Arachis hypogaea]|uniref:protein FAR1-RELATED SEQUENCE 5-like n=1 Tax=Arachis hypogaea TaxID=3818 RepID=UPI0007AF5142
MTEADKAQANSLHDYGVRTCYIMGFMLKQKGGPEKIGFTKKDLYNYFDKSKHAKVKDSDAYATLSYLISKADEDPLLQGKFTLKDNKLENLVWANGASIVDYQYFSDVLAFDTTYQKNKYNKPLVVFSGTNHHGQTCIFGCGLLADEKHETYVLVLKIFLEITGNKHPTAVVTDGDLAMRGAIREVMPNATHRLCAWHLHRNACEAIKNSEFLHGLKHLMYGNFFPDEFEDKWLRLVLKFKLFENEWVKKTYKIKRMWAFVYLNDKLFGRNRTTSQCEGIHSLIKHYIAEDIESEKIVGVRYSALAMLCFTLCDKASKHQDDFMEIREDIFGLIMKLHKRHNPNEKMPSTANLVGDPCVVKTKGAPRQTTKAAKARKCSHCKRISHTDISDEETIH